ncbi:MAG: DEAD/DEAH box helicase [Bacteroidales bacterium]|nr:DEAD/DEAH box helicase [Bacteroidales bacterium]
MKTEIVYLISRFEKFGFSPEAYAVEFDDSNKPGVNCVRVSKTNLSNYSEIIDEDDKALIDVCFKLEKSFLLTLIKEPKIKDWETFYNSFFMTRNASVKTIGLRDYIANFISEKQNLFFTRIKEKRLYLNEGNFPFMWPVIKIVEDLPEVFYYFNYSENQFQYVLKAYVGSRELSLMGGELVSRNRARILIKNRIYEFESGVDGAKLIPFFTKDHIVVDEKHFKDYVEKIILPLVKSNKVIPNGFEINVVDKLTAVKLKVKEVNQQTQLTLFDTSDENASDALLDLQFYYEDFVFTFGKQGRGVKYSTQNGFVIENVIRDYHNENLIVDSLKKIGVNFEFGSKRMPLYDGLEWVSQNHAEINSLGVEIVYLNKSRDPEKLFLGERNIEILLDENNDWFDIRAKVVFGDFVIPFLQILSLIQKGKTSFLLPNGELAQIPESWLQEYLTIFKFVKTVDGKPVVGKHLLRIAQELESRNSLNIKVKENLRRFFNLQNPVEFPIPANFKAELRHYQKYGYNWLRVVDDINLGVCLADDMGLGKTIQALAFIQWLVNEGRGQILIVVPTSLVHNWMNEINKFCSGVRVLNHTGINRSDSSMHFEKYNIILTTYSVLRRDKSIFSDYLFDYCILDESQYIKNPKSDTAQTCYELQAKNYLCLSGTPLENSISDLWSQMNFLNQGMLGSHNHFVRSFKQEGNPELYHKLVNPFLLRRKKSEVLNDLPDKTILLEYSDMLPEQQSFYRELRNRYRDLFIDNIGKNGKLNSVVLLEGLMRLRQASNHPILVDHDFVGDSGKYNSVCLKINEIVSKDSKVLIYSSFVEHLKLYKNYLDSNKIKYCYLDGSTKDRQKQTEIFQNNPDYHVFLLSLKAGGVGLNLTAAEYVFMLDPWWNPAAENQAFDRAHRIGQTKNVFVYKFITKDSIEEKIIKLQNEKTELFEKMIDDKNPISDISVDQILELVAE